MLISKISYRLLANEKTDNEYNVEKWEIGLPTSLTRVCLIWYVQLKIFKPGQNHLEMALEANRKDTTQTRGLVIFIPKIFSTYFCLFPEILL